MSDLLARTLAAAAARARDGQRADLRARGVVPTPAALARYGVARIDELLRSELGIVDGIASAQVVLLDPAVGTGVWLAAVLEHTRSTGARSALLGFDADAEALAVVEQLLAAEARAQGATLTLSCANTLELAAPFPDSSRVRVILGNPPWAARSLSRGGALSDAWLAEFRLDHEGVPLGERRAGVLSDDYVRFFRWALEQARGGEQGTVLCFATNGSFLDGPVHRGMRAALCQAFDRLELIDLGGNSLLSKASRERVRDENLFGVRVGAALTWAVRQPREPVEHAHSVHFAALRGSSADKLHALQTSLSLQALAPSAPWFRFRPSADARESDGFSLADAFVFQREGVQTNRDAIAIAHTEAELTRRIDELLRGQLVLPALRHFDPARARRVLAEARERGQSCVAPLAYRPLDARWFVAHAPLCHRPRSELQAATAHSSLCLLSVRKDRGTAAFNLFAATRTIADACFLSTRSSCRTRVFPSHQPDGAPNLSAMFAEQLAKRIGSAPSPEQTIAYALSILGAPRFRREQQAALQEDYARLPWPRDAAHWAAAVAVGMRFVAALEAPLVLHDQRAGELCYAREARTLSVGGEVLMPDLAPTLWDLQIGHHALVSSVARGEHALPRVLRALRCASAWRSAEQAADALLFA